MKFRDTKVFNFEGAIRGMRNPLKSWEKSDSVFGYTQLDDNELIFSEEEKVKVASFNIDPVSDIREYAAIGAADMKLMQNLIRAGNEHSKFMRQILVSVDITAPRYFWSEFDTYHFNVKNSESTMHKLLSSKEVLTLEDFETTGSQIVRNQLLETIRTLEDLKKKYQQATDATEKLSLKRVAKMILPESYLQKRAVTTNYAELRNIYWQRKNHELPEWKIFFINWIKALPFSEELICFN